MTDPRPCVRRAIAGAREILTQPDEDWAGVIWFGIAFAAGQTLTSFEYGDPLGALLRAASGVVVLLVARQLRRWALEDADATPAPTTPPHEPTPENNFSLFGSPPVRS